MINKDIFYKKIRSLFKVLNKDQMAGLESLLAAWEKSYLANPPEYLAYCLATAYHETAQTMQPIEEYGRGQGRAYGKTGFWGRGYVQLTWKANYVKATKCLNKAGIECDLVKNPKQAMDETIAAYVMYQGMIDGWFTGKKLSNYFDADSHDPVHARRIINGMDCADKIAGYYKIFKPAIVIVPDAPAANIPVS